MKRIIFIALILSCYASLSFGQVDIFHAFYRTSRVAVLPFLNLSGLPEATTPIMESIHLKLNNMAIETANDSVVRQILRQYRIRNTSDLSVSDMQTVANDLDVRYLLVGVIDRFALADSSAEIALSARLIDAATTEVVWAKSIAFSRDPRTRILSVGSRTDTSKVIANTTNKLLRQFNFFRPNQLRPIDTIKFGGDLSNSVPCATMVVVAFANETGTPFAGNLISNQIFSALHRRGFNITDPGRVRELMLASRELIQGEVTKNLLSVFADGLGADLVLTGVVTEFSIVRQEPFPQPAVSFQARLIDPRHNTVVWSKHYERSAGPGTFPASLKITHGLAELSNKLAQQMATDLASLGVPAKLTTKDTN